MPEPLIFGHRSMGAGRCLFSDIFRRAPRPAPRSLQGFPPCNPAPPFEKGGDPKTLSADGQHTFYGRAKNPVCRSRFSLGTDLWTPVAVPSVGVLCSRAWWEASSESPWVFGDASHLHDLKRPSLFRRDEVPARNTNRSSGFAFMPPKSFWGFQGAVFQKRSLAGCGTASHKRRASHHRDAPFQAGQGLCTKHRQTVRLCLHEPKKVFEGSKGRFFKNAPWQGVGQRPTESEKACTTGHAFSGGTKSLHETSTDCPASPSRT